MSNHRNFYITRHALIRGERRLRPGQPLDKVARLISALYFQAVRADAWVIGQFWALATDHLTKRQVVLAIRATSRGDVVTTVLNFEELSESHPLRNHW